MFLTVTQNFQKQLQISTNRKCSVCTTAWCKCWL